MALTQAAIVPLVTVPFKLRSRARSACARSPTAVSAEASLRIQLSSVICSFWRCGQPIRIFLGSFDVLECIYSWFAITMGWRCRPHGMTTSSSAEAWNQLQDDPMSGGWVLRHHFRTLVDARPDGENAELGVWWYTKPWDSDDVSWYGDNG